jgi:Tfp pilus assembly protein PilV
MKRLLSQTTPADHCALRSGSTLSEVLISLLVMSIGVVSLATLFPVSVLRSIQATQLTNAANLRYNVEALTAVRPELLNGGGTWAPNTAYTTNPLSVVVPADQQVRQRLGQTLFYCSTAGTSGALEPNWNIQTTTVPPPGNTTTDGTVTWTAYKAEVYVIDLLGHHLVDDQNTLGFRNYFGNNGTAAATRVPRLTPTWAAANDSNATLNAMALAAASDVATLPDSWIDHVESTDIAVLSGTSIRLNDVTLNLQDSIPPYPTNTIGVVMQAKPRVVMFDVTGKVSVVRPLAVLLPAFYGITPGATPTLSWPASAGALPTGFTPVRARVETHERRYTWLLSVRRGASGASFMDVVVYFRRSYDPREEAIYPAVFTEVFDPGFDGAAGVLGRDDDNDGNTDTQGGVPDPEELGFPGSDDIPRNWVVVEYKSTGDKPLFKKGGFVCDIQNLRWYRILELREAPEIAPFASPFASMPTGNDDLWKPTINVPSMTFSSGGYDRAVWIKVENKILEDGPTTPLTGGAMFSKSVIDVYPIRTRLPWGT